MVSDAFIAEVDYELGPTWSNREKRFVCDAVLRATLSHLSANTDRSPSEEKKAKQLLEATIGALILGHGPLHG